MSTLDARLHQLERKNRLANNKARIIIKKPEETLADAYYRHGSQQRKPSNDIIVEDPNWGIYGALSPDAVPRKGDVVVEINGDARPPKFTLDKPNGANG